MASTASERDRAAIYERYGLTCPPRYATLRNFDNPTYGGKAARIARALGTPFNPWQRYSADVALEVDRRTGLFVYRKVGITVPRQQGKTSLILPTMIHRGMAWQRQRILYAAQNGTSAREKWEDDFVDALTADGSPFAKRVRIRKANGREAVIWRATRSIQGLHANTERAGHGKTLHLGMADEYFAQVDYRIEAAWAPAMTTQPMAQSWWLSTKGTSKSVPLNAEITRGRELVETGEPTRTAYMEWTAEDGADYTDPATWLSCMPSLCPADVDGVCRCSTRWRHTVTIDTIRAELESAQSDPAKLAEWLRAYCNWTREDNEVAPDPNVPTVEEWDLLADAHAGGGEVLALAVDVTPKRDHATIVAAGEGADGGLRRIAVLDYGEGTTWLVPRLVDLVDRLRPVVLVLDERSGANTLIEPLRQAGITRIVRQEGKEPPRGQLWIPTTQEVGAASASITDAVRQGSLVHLGQPELRMAIVGARTRPLGDGSYAFGRKLATGDISPLVAAALALAGYERFKHLAVEVSYDPLANIG